MFVSYIYNLHKFKNKKSLYVTCIQTVLVTNCRMIIQQEQLQFQQPELQQQLNHLQQPQFLLL